MCSQPVRNSVRAAFTVCGLGLIAAGIVIALRDRSDSIALAALLSGVLLVVIGGTGRLPVEIGLQRVSFESHPDASSRHRALVDVVHRELPGLLAIAADHGGLVIRDYWLDELDVPVVLICAPDDWHELDRASVEAVLERTAAARGIVLLTNVEDVRQVRSILQSRHGDRAAVVRWRSHRDNEALRRAAQRLSKVLSGRRKRIARHR